MWASAGPVDYGIQELPATRALLVTLTSSYCVDAARVYATGISNGGGMANYPACRLADRITAVVPIVGNIYEPKDGGCHPAQPVSVLDEFDPASGAVQKRFTNLGRHLFGVAVTADSVRVGSVDDNQLVRIDPQRGEVTGRVADIKGPREIAAVDGQLWVTEFNGNTVDQIKPAN